MERRRMKEPVSSGAEVGDLRLLHVDVKTSFVLSSSERIERTNDPDCSPGPRLFFTGCPQGNIVRIRHDVRDQIASRLLAIAADEPPGRDPDVLPQCLGKIIDILSTDEPVATVAPGLIYRLPNDLQYER